MRSIWILCVTCALLAGCAIISHDLTHAPGMDAIVGKSFVIQQDSFLLENYCEDSSGANSCLLLQVVGGKTWHEVAAFIPYSVEVDLPTLDEYARDPKRYDDTLASHSHFSTTRHDIAATVPKGTIITVTRVIEGAYGESGSGWVVYGAIQSQPGVLIQIGSGQLGGGTYPSWLKRDFPGYGPPAPQPLPEFLQPVSP